MTLSPRPLRTGLLAALCAASLAACDASGPDPAQQTATPTAVSAADDAYAALAQLLAVGLVDPALRRAVYDGAAARFNGAPEILYSDLAVVPVGGALFQDALLRAFADRRSLVEATGLLQTALTAGPTLTVAVPVHMATWDPETEAPLATYVPTGVDDVDVVSVEAFTPAGGRVELSATETPAQPVVVVGPNERTDAAGAVRPEYAPTAQGDAGSQMESEIGECGSDAFSCGGGGGGGTGGGGTGGGTAPTARTGVHPHTLHWVNVIDDREPWFKEPAEIILNVNGSSAPAAIAYRGTIGDPEPDNQRHYFSRFLFNWNPDTFGYFTGSRWHEEDPGTTISFNVGLSGQIGKDPQIKASVGFTFQWKDGDDDLGSVPVNYSDALSTVYNTGYIEWAFK